MWRSPYWACEKGSTRNINTSSVQISSRAWRACGETGILSLLWIWHELGPGPQGMWWMHYLIFLSLFTSLGRQLAAILQWLATLRSCRSLDFYKLCRFGTDHDWDKLQLPAKPVLLFDETHSWRVWELMCAPLTLGCVSAAGWWELLTSYLRMSDYRVKAYVCGCPTDKPCWK